MANAKTSIHIFPSYENGEENYTIIALDEKAHAEFQAGKDTENTNVTGFCIKNHNGKAIQSIIIELVDGKPTSVHTVEE